MSKPILLLLSLLFLVLLSFSVTAVAPVSPLCDFEGQVVDFDEKARNNFWLTVKVFQYEESEEQCADWYSPIVEGWWFTDAGYLRENVSESVQKQVLVKGSLIKGIYGVGFSDISFVGEGDNPSFDGSVILYKSLKIISNPFIVGIMGFLIPLIIGILILFPRFKELPLRKWVILAALIPILGPVILFLFSAVFSESEQWLPLPLIFIVIMFTIASISLFKIHKSFLPEKKLYFYTILLLIISFIFSAGGLLVLSIELPGIFYI